MSVSLGTIGKTELLAPGIHHKVPCTTNYARVKKGKGVNSQAGPNKAGTRGRFSVLPQKGTLT